MIGKCSGKDGKIGKEAAKGKPGGKSAGAKGADERRYKDMGGRVYPDGEYAGQGNLSSEAVKCRVCGWGLMPSELHKVMNTSRKSEYNGEPNFGHCGQTECAEELQARVDCESAIEQMKDVQNLLNLSGTRLAANYADSSPHHTVAQLYKWMDKSIEFFSERLAIVNYDREWYNTDPFTWQ